MGDCTVLDCGSTAKAAGLCAAHLHRQYRYGDPLAGGPARQRDVMTRIQARYAVQENGCWLWTHQLNNKGYGLVSTGGGKRAAHVVLYELTVGPVPDGMELDHVCHNADPMCPGGLACIHRRCVNPAHMEPVTHGENQRRSGARQLSCRRAGHDWTDPRNLYVDPAGGKRCAECARQSSRARVPSRKAAV